MASYEEHCRTLGSLTKEMVSIVEETLPLQTFKEKIDPKSHKILTNVGDELTAIGNDGLSIVERAQRPPCGILLGTSSAGKTELLGSFLPKLRTFSGSTAADTTPMLVRMRYPKDFSPEDHGRVTFLMPRDLVKLMYNLPKVKNAMREDSQLADSWDRVVRLERSNEKRDLEFERKLYSVVRDWVREAYQWARVNGDADDSEYFRTLSEITDHFDPESTSFQGMNPIPRSLLISFLDKGKKANHLADVIADKLKMGRSEAKESGKKYYSMRTCGAITDLFVEEDILQDIDIYDTAGVRVGGDEADILKPDQMVHSQIQAYKNRWGFERLIPSVDIIIFILVLEEQQVDTEFQSLFEECRKHGNLKNRLFVFLNKLDKAVVQAVKKDDVQRKGKDVIPEEDKTWKLWVQTNVMDKIRGLGDDFQNVFVCRAPKFKIADKDSQSFLENSNSSPTLNRYLYDAKKNIKAALDDGDGGIKFAWKTVERIMRNQGSKIRFERLGQQILPFAKDLKAALSTKRVDEQKPSNKEIDTYLEKLLRDLEDLRWNNDEFRLPELFGEFCIQKKFCTSKQVKEALEIQEKMSQETGRSVRLGQILVDNKRMTLEQVREVLQASETEEDDWEVYQSSTFKHVKERVCAQISEFMEEKGRPIIHGNIPVEAVIEYLTEPIDALEQELRGLYDNNERKEFQEAVQNVMECQLLAALWNQERLRKHLWAQKSKITSSFDIRDDISKEEAEKVTECYDRLQEILDRIPEIEESNN